MHWISTHNPGVATPDNGILLGHGACAQGQTGGDDGRQALGDGCYSQRYSYLEVVGGLGQVEGDLGYLVLGPVLPLELQETLVVDGPHGDADAGDDLGAGSS